MPILSNYIKYKSDYYIIIEYKENEVSKRVYESINELINRDSNTTVPLFRLKMTCFSACFTVLPVTLWNSLDFNCKQIWFACSELWNNNIYKIIINMAFMSQLKPHPIVHLVDEGVKLFGTLPCRTFALRGHACWNYSLYQNH